MIKDEIVHLLLYQHSRGHDLNVNVYVSLRKMLLSGVIYTVRWELEDKL